MRVLVVSPVLPYPPTWGFAMRVFQIVRVLARTHAVSLVAFDERSDDEARRALAPHGVSTHVVQRASSLASKRYRQVSSLLSTRSYQWRGMASAAMQRTLDRAMQEGFDIIQIESSQLGVFAYDSRARRVLDEHNIEFELLHRMAATERSAVRRAYNWIEYKKFRREEIRTWHSMDGCVMTSAREEVVVRRLAPRTPVITVPNGVDVDYFHPPEALSQEPVVVMTGLMKYRPNVDAAQFFAREILPRIRAKRPDVTFYIVGAEPSDEVKQLAGTHVVVTGSVPDVRPYVRRAAALVVPLRMGSGTRLKVLEGLAMGMPMVSTSLGCEGIDVVDRQHLLVRDAPEDFAAGVLELLDDRELASSLGSAGRQLVYDKYRWDSVIADLERFYHTLSSSPAGVPVDARRREPTRS